MTRPNIVMIDCHDLGQHLGCYGQRTVNSPNLDRMAEQGVLFENCFCTAPQCSPARAALYTGRYPHSTGVLGLAHAPFNWHLYDEERYLAKYLQNAGYDTALIGIQHVTEATEERVSALGFDSYQRLAKAKEEAGPLAKAFLEAPERKKKPFFLNVGFFEPHRAKNGRFDAKPDFSLGVETPSYLPDIPEAHQEIAELQGLIRRMDEGFGIIFQALHANDLLDNTLLIFTADHGLAMPRAKCSLYDPGIEVALMMHWPDGGLHRGHRFSELISHVDVVPTILDILDLPQPEHLHGQSFWPLLQKDSYQPNEAIFAEKTYHTAYEPMRCIRTTTHKLIVNLEVDIAINLPSDVQKSRFALPMVQQITAHRPHIEVYDLSADPDERQNLAGQATVARIEGYVRQRLLEWMQLTDDPLLNGPLPSPYYYESLRQLMLK